MPNGATDGGGAEGPTDDGAPAVADAALDAAEGGVRADAGSIVEFPSCSQVGRRFRSERKPRVKRP